jgi:hypothetical protein
MPSQRKWMLIAVAALAFNLGLATAVIAGHRFGDVPNTNIFHGDITWLADNEITRGCNPPTNTQFCPKDNVTREQMAAFIRRMAQTYGTAGDSVSGSTDFPSGAHSVASVEVNPKDEVGVVITGTVNVSAGALSKQAFLSKDACVNVLARALVSNNFSATPTYRDVVSEPTTYHLCVVSAGSFSVGSRTLTAFWAPTG